LGGQERNTTPLKYKFVATAENLNKLVLNLHSPRLYLKSPNLHWIRLGSAVGRNGLRQSLGSESALNRPAAHVDDNGVDSYSSHAHGNHRPDLTLVTEKGKRPGNSGHQGSYDLPADKVFTFTASRRLCDAKHVAACEGESQN